MTDQNVEQVSGATLDTAQVELTTPLGGTGAPSTVDTDAVVMAGSHIAEAESTGTAADVRGVADVSGAADANGADLNVAGFDVAVLDGADLDAVDMAKSIAVLAESDVDGAERRRVLGRLAGQIRSRGVGDLFKPKAAMRWIADAVGEVVPHLPIRDIGTLRRHFPGLSDEEITARLVRNAARATGAIGAAGGGVAAVEWVATPTLLTAPVVLAAETVAVVAVEIKLIGELHELYGSPVSGTATQRTVSLVQSWAQRRGVNPIVPGIGVAAVLGTAARKELRDRLLRRFGRNLTSYGPLLTGAAVASYLNRRATLALAQHIRDDLIDVGRRKVIEARPHIEAGPHVAAGPHTEAGPQ